MRVVPLALNSCMVPGCIRLAISLLIFSIILLFSWGVQASQVPKDANVLKLIGRSDFKGDALGLSEDEWKWVRNKQIISVGVAAPNFAPLEILSSGLYYEGINADVLGVIGTLLRVEVRIVQFPDRPAALNALAQGEIDLVGSANTYELVSYPVRLSESYASDQPVLYVRKSEARPMPRRLSGMRIAIADDYLPREQLGSAFPDAEFVAHRAREQALAALAFGHVDLYLGDAASSNYLVNLSYFNDVRVLSELDMPTKGFAFAVHADADRLRSVLNSALQVVRSQYSSEILKRWSGGGGAIGFPKINLSPAEQRWISRNPVVRFVVTGDSAPLAYFDTSGQYSGVGSDLARAISLRTGLSFEPVVADQQADHRDYILEGKADLSALVATVEREDHLRFTRPIFFTSYAIIVRNEPGQPSSLEDLKNKRIALPRAHALRDFLQPSTAYNFVEAETLLDAMEMVSRGYADASVAFLPVAQYYTMAFRSGELKISNIIENIDAPVAFAVRREDTELASILDKALLSIPPDELDIFQNRWRPRADVSRGRWIDYRGLILQISGVAFLFIILSFVWNFYIRSQFKRRQQAESALSEQLNFMNSLINGIPHPIYVRDREGRMVTCNTSYLEVFGKTLDEVLGKTSLEGGKINRQEALQFYDDYMQVMQNGEPLEVDRELHLPGRALSIYHWIYPYYESQGQIKGVICGWIDISERHQLAEDLRAALDAADEASRAKTTFLATMSHEIRTPLSAVIGMLELAMKHADQGRLDRPAIEVAYDSAKSLLELIGDILDVVRIESGHISLSPKRANLRELVESVARVFDGLARQKALSLKLHIDASVNRDVLVDPMRFKQVLSNLVSNAIKFTDTGEVRVNISGDLVESERLQVRLSVEDTGIGVSAEELAKLFQPFAQANHGLTSRGGTGLGLVICKSLCELMGGVLTVESYVGKGTCVTLDISFNVLSAIAGDALPELDEEAGGGASLNILVVDDQQANRMLLAQQLSFLGQSVQSAENGERGLELWREGGIDVIFTDCNMPVLNGYEMARAIRGEEAQRLMPQCAIIGFTANAQVEEKAKCLDAGMDDCLFKPVSLKVLSSVLSSLAVLKQVRETSLNVPAQLPSQKITEILHDLTGGNAVMTQALISEARSSFTRDLTDLRGLQQSLVPEALADLVHRIRGGARIVQARKIIEACEHVESLCCDRAHDVDAIMAHAAIIESELEMLIVQLDLVDASFG